MSNYCCNAFGCSNSTLKKNNVEKYSARNKRKNDSCRFERFDSNLTKSQTSFHGYVPNT